jgi:hypothetical protein
VTPLSPHPFPLLVEAEARRAAGLHPPLSGHNE